MKRQLVIGGNWKLQITKMVEAQNIFSQLRSCSTTKIETFIALPSYFLPMIESKGIEKAAQNIHWESHGPYTGETSVDMLVESEVKYALIGHSERRIIFGETDKEINKKVKLALERNIRVVLCIGETAKENNEGRTKEVLENQLFLGLKDITSLENVIIAYEPVWAINNKMLNPEGEIRAASPEEAQMTHQTIRSMISNLYGDEVGNKVRIIYGGSMKPENAKQLLTQPDIDGGLIGGASTTSDQFCKILTIANSI